MATALNRTTITAALKASDDVVSFASGATLKVGHLAYIDREAIELLALVDPALPTIWRVQRGVFGTGSAAHAINNQIYTGTPDQFSMTNPQGSASQDSVLALPYINIVTGDVYTLSTGGSWQKVGDAGVPIQPAWASGGVATYTTAGAITIQNGSSTINSATARAMTLASPAQADDGTVMTIYGIGGGAHTVTTPLGFNAAGGSYDVATFGATGGTLIVQAIDLAWRVVSATGVTFS